jgi:hypothetical protein
MHLYRVTALIALVMIVVLCAGYAATEDSGQEQGLSVSSATRS